MHVCPCLPAWLSVCMYACLIVCRALYVCKYVCIVGWMSARRYVCMYVCVAECVYVYLQACAYACTYVYGCGPTPVYMYGTAGYPKPVAHQDTMHISWLSNGPRVLARPEPGVAQPAPNTPMPRVCKIIQTYATGMPHSGHVGNTNTPLGTITRVNTNDGTYATGLSSGGVCNRRRCNTRGTKPKCKATMRCDRWYMCSASVHAVVQLGGGKTPHACMPVWVYACPPFCVCMSVSLTARPSVCMPTCLPDCLPVLLYSRQYIRICVSVWVPLCVCMDVCLYVCLPVGPYTCMYACMCVCMHVWSCIYVCVCPYAYMAVWLCVCMHMMYVCVHICMYVVYACMCL